MVSREAIKATQELLASKHGAFFRAMTYAQEDSEDAEKYTQTYMESKMMFTEDRTREYQGYTNTL